jgi:hypothetical protein
VASHLRSVIRIRTRAGKARDDVSPRTVSGDADRESGHMEGRDTPVGSEMVRIGRGWGHVSHVGVGILIRPRALRWATR